MDYSMAEQECSYYKLKQNFLSNVSHEFRTPVTAIQGYLTLLEQGSLGGLLPEQAEALKIVMRNMNRLNRLINDLLDFSSLARGKLLLEGDIVDIDSVLLEAIQRSSEYAHFRDIKLRVEHKDLSSKVLGDKEHLVQIFAHLLENAIKFSRSGQKVVLSTFHRHHQVAVKIHDSGIGMTAEQLASAFIPFMQGDNGLCRRYGGLGMGLPLIHNLVALHGGEINLSSKPNQGTTALVTLPLLNTE